MILVFLALSSLFAGFFYLMVRLGSFTWLQVLIGVCFACMWLMPLSRIFRLDFRQSLTAKLVFWPSYLSMGFLSFLLSIALLRELIFIPLSFASASGTQIAFSATGDLAVLSLTFISFAYGIWRASSGPKLKSVDVSIANLASTIHGLKIVQISDLHIDAIISKSYVDRVVALANKVEADFIFLTGDIIDGHYHQLRDLAQSLGQLRAKKGVFFIPGNHEYYWEWNLWLDEMRKLGFTVLLNQHKIVDIGGQALAVAGVTDYAAAYRQIGSLPDPKQAIAGGEEAVFKILLAHNPKIAPDAEKVGFDLQVSGHTHGGQFWPWTHIVRRVHRFSQGLYQRGNLRLYVSPGTGSWGPPIRFGTTPELTVLTLKT